MKYSGPCSGTFTLTFTLTWTQSGSRLTGSIQLTSRSTTSNVTGLLKADTITFGTVGSTAITYEGTLSATSMTGQYHSGPAATGGWSATKTA